MDGFKVYWAYAGERALKTFSQVAIATIGVGAAGIMDVDWAPLAGLFLFNPGVDCGPCDAYFFCQVMDAISGAVFGSHATF